MIRELLATPDGRSNGLETATDGRHRTTGENVMTRISIYWNSAKCSANIKQQRLTNIFMTCHPNIGADTRPLKPTIKTSALCQLAEPGERWHNHSSSAGRIVGDCSPVAVALAETATIAARMTRITTVPTWILTARQSNI